MKQFKNSPSSSCSWCYIEYDAEDAEIDKVVFFALLLNALTNSALKITFGSSAESGMAVTSYSDEPISKLSM